MNEIQELECRVEKLEETVSDFVGSFGSQLEDLHCLFEDILCQLDELGCQLDDLE